MSRIEVRGKCLIQRVLSRLSGDRALASLLLLVYVFNHFIALHLLPPGHLLLASVHASSHSLGVVRNCLVRTHVLFMDQVVGGRDRVVPVGFDALDRIVAVEPVLVLHALEYELVVGHLLLPWVETEDPFLFVHFEPGVLSDFIN